jgi:hypothetical protein
MRLRKYKSHKVVEAAKIEDVKTYRDEANAQGHVIKADGGGAGSLSVPSTY